MIIWRYQGIEFAGSFQQFNLHMIDNYGISPWGYDIKYAHVLDDAELQWETLSKVERKFGYKVINHLDGAFFSMSNKRLRIQYFVGTWVAPKIKNSRLFLFNNFEDAAKAAFLSFQQIWLCEVDIIIPQTHSAMYDWQVELFWQNPDNDLMTFALENVFTANRVKLITRMD